jgi:crossover junction endonuclease EME1
MPVEIIDLLSSPDLPRPAATRAKINTAPIKNTFTYEPSKQVSDPWFNLLSDGISLPLPKSLAAKPSISKQPASTLNGISKSAQSANPVKGRNDFYFLSDDFDSNLSQPKSPAGKPSATSAIPKSNLSGASKQDQPAKGITNFEFLSDDFDIITGFNDPFALDEPLPKKRRLTPSPKASTKTAVPKKTEFKRPTSNIESSSKTNTSRTKNPPSSKRYKTTGNVLKSDPIMFTSSPDPIEDAARRRKDKRKETLYEDEDEEGDSLFDLGRSRNEKIKKSFVSGRGILESTHGNRRNAFTIDNSSDFDLPDVDSLVPKPGSKPPKSSQTALAKYKAEKAKEKATREKAEKLKDKHASKGAEKEQKRLAKEQKIRDKEKAAEVAKVNILRTDKKVSAPEMIVDISSCLESKLAGQVRNFLTPLQIEHSDWQSLSPVIKWRRKVVAEWNDEKGHWEPVPLSIKTEKHVMCILSAKEFVDLAMGDESQNLDVHVLRLKASFDSSKIIYMIEGLTAWMRKNRNVKNRQFTAAVRSHFSHEEQAQTAGQRTKKWKEQEYVNEDMIEDALLRLQVIHGTLIHHTAAMIETAEWVVTFTQHISTIPYKYAFPMSYPFHPVKD